MNHWQTRAAFVVHLAQWLPRRLRRRASRCLFAVGRAQFSKGRKTGGTGGQRHCCLAHKIIPIRVFSQVMRWAEHSNARVSVSNRFRSFGGKQGRGGAARHQSPPQLLGTRTRILSISPRPPHNRDPEVGFPRRKRSRISPYMRIRIRLDHVTSTSPIRLAV